MSSTKIEDSIISAVEILTERAMSKAGFDKTIQAVIKSCEDRASGKYMVTYQDSTFYAYSTAPNVFYATNVAVYVQVPAGDFRNTKTILGTVAKLGEDYITVVEEKASYDIIGQNMYAGSSIALQSGKRISGSVATNDITNDKQISTTLTSGYQYYLKGAHYLQLQADVHVGPTVDVNPNRGNFAMEVDVNFLDNTKQTVTRTYKLSTTEMIGNPYTATSAVTQSFIYEIDGDNFQSIKEVRFIANGFKDGSPVDDIYFENIQINALEPLEYLSDGGLGLSIITKEGTIANSKPLSIEAIVKSKGTVYNSKKIEYHWFMEDGCTATGPGYSSYAGVGWKNLNQIPGFNIIGTSQNKVWVPAAFIRAEEIRFLCAAVVDGIVITKKIIFRNLNSTYQLKVTAPNTTFYYDSGTYNLTAQLYNRSDGKATDPTGLTYHWYMMNSNGQYMILNDGKTTSGAVKNIVKFAKFFCVVTDVSNAVLASGEITVTNALEGGGYSLIIKNGDVLYKYNEKGTSPCANSRPNPQVPKTLYFEIYDPDGNLEFDSMVNKIDIFSSLTWLFPNSDTLLKTSFTTTLPDQGGFKVYSKKEKFEYTIEDRYNASKSRNEIQLVLNYKGNALTAVTNFTFTKEGANGTNGTDYSAKIVRVGYKSEPKFNNNYNNFKIQVYKDGVLTYDGPTTNDGTGVTWSILRGSKQSTKDSLYTVSPTSGPTTAVTFPASYSNTTSDILKATIKLPSGYYLYAFYPLEYGSSLGTNLFMVEGFKEVTFDSSGANPEYDSDQPWILHLYNSAGNEIAVDQSKVTWVPLPTTGSLLNVTKKDGKTYVQVASNYNGTTNNAILCSYGSYKIKIPVHLGLNRYGNFALNEWDGSSIDISTKEGFILAPQIAAGKKTSSNGFTGIVMGTQQKTSTETKIGLFGYSDGVRTIFLDADTGNATFNDKEGMFEIKLTPSSSDTKNKDKIIDAGTIDSSGKKTSVFYVQRNGYLFSTSGSIGGWNINSNSLSFNYTGSKPNPLSNGSTYSDYKLQLNTNGSRSGAAFIASQTVYTYNSGVWSSSETSCKIGYNGVLTANGADISGKITATSGKIGNWTISPPTKNDVQTSYTINGSLSFGTPGKASSALLCPCGYEVTSTNDLVFGGTKTKKHTWVQTIGQNFAVDNTGGLYCSSGEIGGFNIENLRLQALAKNDRGEYITKGVSLFTSAYNNSVYPMGGLFIGEAGHGVVQIGRYRNHNTSPFEGIAGQYGIFISNNGDSDKLDANSGESNDNQPGVWIDQTGIYNWYTESGRRKARSVAWKTDLPNISLSSIASLITSTSGDGYHTGSGGAWTGGGKMFWSSYDIVKTLHDWGVPGVPEC